MGQIKQQIEISSSICAVNSTSEVFDRQLQHIDAVSQGQI